MLISQFYAKGDKQITIQTDGNKLGMYILSNDGSRVSSIKSEPFIFDKSKKYCISFDENCVFLEEAQQVIQPDNAQ